MCISDIFLSLSLKNKNSFHGKISEKLIKLEEEIIEEAISKPLEIIKRKIRNKNMTYHFTDKIFSLIKRLENHIIPNESEIVYSNTSNLPSSEEILNAGWFYKIACSSSLLAYKKQEEYVNNLNTINNLLLKAIELSYFHNEYYRWLKTKK